MQRLVLLDGNSLLNRAYFALPPLTGNDGVNVNAVYGFVNLMLKILSEYKPDRLAVTFDKKGHNFRKDIYDQYKANRKGMPDDLAAQLPVLHDVLNAMQVKVVEIAGVEADDLIGTLARKLDAQSLIVTGDRDMLQLVNDNTNVILTKKGISEVERVDLDVLKANYGLTPMQVVEYKALRGDTSDNIPGVKGIGEKTATALIAKYGDIDGVYSHIDEQKGALKQKLLEDKEMAYISRQLATIVTDVDVDCTLEQCTLPVFNDEVKQLFAKLQFRSLLSRLDEQFDQPVNTVEEGEDVHISDRQGLSQAVAELQSCSCIAMYMDDNSIVLCGNAKKQFTVEISDNFIAGLLIQDVFEGISGLLCSQIPKVVFDIKTMRHRLESNDIVLNNVLYDLSLMQYLTEQRSCKTLKELMDIYGYTQYGIALVALKDKLHNILQSQDTLKLYEEVELPLAQVLYDMEKEGVKVDVDGLDVLSAQYQAEIEQLSQKIYEYAGETFNISSPKQLSVVLFDKLKLKHFKKTATGYSTNNDVLEKLRGEHPIIEQIIQYRKVSKLNGTYVEGLRPLIKRGLVHTTFNQYLTTTGRLSSSDPNLQNIPIRNEQGKEIRKLFLPKYGVFVGADYSQIELRLLAAFSGDANLLHAFTEGQDIHSRVASELLGIPQEMVNADMRRMAKAVNFGIIYGISDFGLSENVGTSVKKAHDYINLYFSRFPSIKQYLDSSVATAKQNGYVTTILGRRRYIPEIKSSNFNMRSFGERAAMNMPLQGSAADIMKVAMIKVYNALQANGLKSKIVLQVHDELIVDTYPEEQQAVADILKREMENAVSLACPLVADVDVGESLYDA